MIEQILEAYSKICPVDIDQPIVGPTLIQVKVWSHDVVHLDRSWKRVEHILGRQGLSAAYSLGSNGSRIWTIRRPDPQAVTWESMVTANKEWVGKPGRYVVGLQPDGSWHCGDLADSGSPHLLVAGQSGSGKSIWLQSLAATLALSGKPGVMRLVLIDPKRVTFIADTFLSKLGRCLETIAYDSNDAIKWTDILVGIMEARYQSLQKEKCIDIDAYNAIYGDMPRIVLICDEFQDIITDYSISWQFQANVQRLGAKARAVGIHLVLATQRPDRDTVRPGIKANLGGKICLRVASKANSRIVLDANGAESLLGKGDILADLGKGPVRSQGAMI